MRPDLGFYDYADWTRQALQRFISSMGPTNSIYHDEIRLIRDNR